MERYARQIVLPELGLAGQQRLRSARVLVIGAGGLGSPTLLYLAAAGVGTLGIVDDDVVQPSNLHRQLLHGTGDVGRPKLDSARDALLRLNPEVALELHRARLTQETAEEIFDGYDLVVDGSDNYATRYAANDACVRLGIPWIYASVERFSGQISTFAPGGAPCYRCLFPEPPAPGTSPSCEEIGVIGAVPGMLGAMQALEAIKWIAGIGELLTGVLVQLDFLTNQRRAVRYDRRPDCVACGGTVHANAESRMQADTPHPLPPPEVEPGEAQTLLAAAAPPLLLDVREPWEVKRASIPNALAIPLRQIEEDLDRVPRDSDVIVYCHHGGRSRAVTEWLRSMGYRARNLSGGIDRWSREIDASVPRY